MHRLTCQDRLGTSTWKIRGETMASSASVLLFDEKTGSPTHLINGVQPYSHPYTFTLIQVRNRISFARIDTANDHFTKTGSGQT